MKARSATGDEMRKLLVHFDSRGSSFIHVRIDSKSLTRHFCCHFLPKDERCSGRQVHNRGESVLFSSGIAPSVHVRVSERDASLPS